MQVQKWKIFIDTPVITCDEIIDPDLEAKSYNKVKLNDKERKTIPTNFNKKKYNLQNFYILLAFLLFTIALLIAVSIYCYLIKY